MPIITDNNVINIVNSLESLPNVESVRAHYVIKKSSIETYGKNAVSFRCFVTHPNVPDGHDVLITMATEEVYSNQTYADQIVGNIIARIKSMQENTSRKEEFKNLVSAILKKDDLGNYYIKFSPVDTTNK